MRITVCFLFCAVFAIPAQSQGIIPAQELPAAIQVLDNAPSKNSLPCYIRAAKKAQLDFIFRYTTAFSIECRLAALEAGQPYFALVRVTPENRKPVVMIEEFDIPSGAANEPDGYEMSSAKKMRILMGGGFAMGTGRYSAEVVLTDQHGHTSKKQWHLGTAEEAKRSKDAPNMLGPGAVAPLLDVHWDGKLASKGLRLTVLLHISRNSDGAFLLPSLSSLLSAIPCQSVKLIAFNLDRQQEIFHENRLDSDSFATLAKTLQQKEFITISYQSLARDAWKRFLVEMTRRELNEQPDAIVFLGLYGTHAWEKVSPNALRETELPNSRVFYLKYFTGADRPADALERLTKDLHGSVFNVYSPETLADAMHKIQAQIKTTPNQQAPSPGASPSANSD